MYNNRPYDSFQVLGVCQCGVSLQTTLLHPVKNPDILGIGTGKPLMQATIQCGRCQRSYRYMAQEEP